MQGLGGAPGGLQQVELQVAAKVLATPGAIAASAASAEQVAKQSVAKDVAKCLEDIADVAELRRLAGAGKSRVAITIVAGPLLRVAEDLERFGGFLELDYRFLVIRVAVRVILQGCVAVCIGDLLVRSCPRQPEDLVVVCAFPPSVP